MSDSYLNKAGLTYFWSKLKAWASGLFVHLTGDEEIRGLKVFTFGGTAGSYNYNNGPMLQNKNLIRGTPPSSDQFCSLAFVDGGFDAISSYTQADVAAHRLATIDFAYRSTGRVDFQFYVMNPANILNDGVRFRIGYEANGVPYFIGPSTRDNPGNGEIITYDWLPKDTRLVHTTGNETVSGIKTFESDIRELWSIVLGRDTAKGSTTQSYRGLYFCSSGGYYAVDRLAKVESHIDSNGYSKIYLSAYKNEANTNTDIKITVGWDANGGYATAPSTRSNRTEGTDIVTRDWIPNDTRIVHTTGDETIGGSKTFANNWTAFSGTDPNVALDNTVAVRTATPSSLLRWRVMPRDRNGDAFGTLCWSQRTSGSSDVRLDVCNANAELAYFYLGWDANGVAYATAPSTSASRSTATDIVTRDWIPNDTRIVHTTGNETIGGYKTFSNSPTVYLWEGDNTIQAMRINVVKGTNPTGSGKYATVAAFEKSGNLYVANRIAALNLYVDTGGNTYASLTAYKYVSGVTDTSDFACICAPDGTSYQRSTIIRPLTNNAYSLGTGTYKYTAVYATNGSIQTSDERFKHDIDFIPDAVLDVWESVEWKQFRMLDSVQKKGRASARVHAGAIAQQIQKAFADAGLDAAAYGFFCHDEWEQTQEVRDGDGRVVVPYNPAGDSYSLRYDEVLCIEAAYMRRENASLKKRVADLEERLAALELKMS